MNVFGQLLVLVLGYCVAYVANAQPGLAWHGIYESDGSVSSGEGQFELTDDGDTTFAHSCALVDSLHLFSINSSRVIAAGCSAICAGEMSCDFTESGFQRLSYGTVYVSRDGSLWRQETLHDPVLLAAGQIAASVPSTVQNAGVHCLIGGYPVQDVRRNVLHLPNASASVVCTTDGRTWVKQADLPGPRAQAKAVVYTLPGEAHPRIFILGGSIAKDSDDTSDFSPVSPESWLLMSEPVLGPQQGQQLNGTAVHGWQTLVAIPPSLKMTALVTALAWPGIDDIEETDLAVRKRFKNPGILVGLGYDSSEPGSFVPSLDWWYVEDPRNESLWIRAPGARNVYRPWGFYAFPWATHVLHGNIGQSSVGMFQGNESNLALMISHQREVMFLSEYSLVWGGLRSQMSSATDNIVNNPNNIGDEMGYGSPLAPHSVVQQTREEDGMPYLIVLVSQGIMRGFPRWCSLDCGTGSTFARRCGVDPWTPLCTPCSLCGAELRGAPSTYMRDACTTGRLRSMNKDSVCIPCTDCGASNLSVVRECSTSQDAMCGLMNFSPPGPPAFTALYIPTSRMVESAHASAVTGVLYLAACGVGIIVLAAIFAPHPNDTRPSTSAVDTVSVSCERKYGLAIPAVDSVKEADASVARSSASTTASPPTACVHSEMDSSTEMHEVQTYKQAKQHSIQHEGWSNWGLWGCSLVFVACDVILALTSQLSVVAVAMSLLDPDQPPARVLPAPGTQRQMQALGRSLAAVALSHVLLLLVLLRWLGKRYLSLMGSNVLLAWVAVTANRVALTLTLVLLPLHSRLAACLLPGGPLQFPAPPRRYALLALALPISLLLFDVPALAIVCEVLYAGGYPARSWLSSDVPSLARTTLIVLIVNLAMTSGRVAWDIASCARNGGVYRLRRSLRETNWHGMVSLLLPASLKRRDAHVEVVPAMSTGEKRLSSHGMYSDGARSGGGVRVLHLSPLVRVQPQSVQYAT